MNAALRVLSPGLVTTLQDLGRPGYARLGIPGGGALDPVALRAANALAGNPQDAGALEVTYAGPALAIDAQSARLAFAGADAAIEILSGMDATCGRTVETMRSVRVQRGQIVRIGPLIRSALLYIAVEGGFEVEPVLAAYRHTCAAASEAGRGARWSRATGCRCASTACESTRNSDSRALIWRCRPACA